VLLQLYAGKFAAQAQAIYEQQVRDWCAGQIAGGGPIELVGITQVIVKVLGAAAQTQYGMAPCR